MTEFRRISKTSSFITGSIESETGSEYLFGYSADEGLMWLERKGKQYSASDGEWGRADAFLRSSLSSTVADGAGDAGFEVEEQRPTSVRRSVASVDYDMGIPTASGGRGIDDDDLAGRAMAFLSGDTDGFPEPEDYEEIPFDEDLSV